MDYQLGLVLSGGGVRGAAHAGVIKALQETDIEVDCIAGASAGAITGALHAAGCGPEEILQAFKEMEGLSIANFALTQPGLLNTENYFLWLHDYLGGATFESFEKKLFIATTDLLRGKYRIFDSGPLIPAVQASAAAPLVFSPVEIEDSLYADGGIINNFPIEPLLEQCNRIIGVSVNPLVNVQKEDLKNIFDVLERIYHITARYETSTKVEACDWLVQPNELLQFNIFDMDKAEDAYEIGYRQAMEVVGEVKEAL